MQNKLVVLSLDSLQSDDLEVLLSMPNFSKLKNKFSIVKNLEEVYPTLTYPIHTTILTGVTPDKHGIFHNQKNDISPEDHDWSLMGSDWYWYKDNIKVETIIDVSNNNGKKVATVCWPVTAGDKRGINLPEIWPRRHHKEEAKAIFEKASSKIAFERYFDSYISKFNWENNEDLVRFTPEIAIDILKNDKPDLLMCHVIMLDHIRHTYGVYGKEVKDCLRQLDILFGRFIDATIQAKTYDKTNFIILGDHGQIDIEGIFELNVLFVENGLIELDENNNPIDYIAYSFSSGFSTQIILKEPNNLSNIEKVYKILNNIKEKYPEYIERIYTKEEAEKEEHLSGNFSFVIEGTKGTYFGTKFLGKVYIKKHEKDYYVYSATHGHSVKKGKKPPLLAFGPDIKENITIQNKKMIDVCPTLAKLLDLNMPNVMGKCIEIIK